MDMNIRYGNMNPLSELPRSIATGLGLGMQARRMKKEEQTEDAFASNIPIQEPGERPIVEPRQVFKEEAKGLSQYKAAKQQLSKIKDPVLKQETMENLSKSIKNPIIAELYRNDINPQDVENTLRAVVIGDPTAQDKLTLLIGQTGGENAPFAKAIELKKAQIQTEQQNLDKQYSIRLRSTISQIEDARENPQKYARKGQAAESVLKGLQNEGNYLSTLAQLSSEDSKWVEDYLRRQQEKRGQIGGRASPNWKPIYDKEGRMALVNTRTGQIDKVNKDFTYVGRDELSQAELMGSLIAGQKTRLNKPDISQEEGSKTATQKAEEARGRRSTDNIPKDKIATEAIIKQYIQKYGKEKALEKLKADGYK